MADISGNRAATGQEHLIAGFFGGLIPTGLSGTFPISLTRTILLQNSAQSYWPPFSCALASLLFHISSARESEFSRSENIL